MALLPRRGGGRLLSPRAARPGTRIVRVRAEPLDLPLREPFEIATTSKARFEGVLVRARLADGSEGFGECAPLASFHRESPAEALAAARRAGAALEGEDAARFLPLARRVEELCAGMGSVRAGLEMAALDAWARSRGLPLWAHFGGASSRVASDITVSIVAPAAAASAARRIARRGVGTIKVKVGRDPEEDFRRVDAVRRAAPRARLIVDANQGYDAARALSLLRLLRRAGTRPVLFEQPVPREDWDGLEEVARKGGVPVAADESVSSRQDALRMARARAAQVVNVKLMKYGLAEALEVARICAAAGLGLMMGGMVESRLAMLCAAHFAAGLGDFSFIDLDTPLWLAQDPFRGGPRMGRGGVYELSRVRAGIGALPVRPKAAGT